LLIGIVAGVVMKLGGEDVPLGGIDRADFGNSFCGFADGGAEAVIAHRGARETDDGVTFTKRVVYGEIVHRRDDFAFSEVSGRAKQDHCARFCGTAVRHSGTHRFGSHGLSLIETRTTGAVQPARKLYLNPEVAQVALQLLWVLKVNGVEAELSRTLQVQRAIVYKDAFFDVSLRNFEGDAKNCGFWFARMDVAGAEEHGEIATKLERFDAVLIEFEWLVVDGADEVFAGGSDGVEDFARAGKRARLREHKRDELFACEGARAVEERAVQIFLESDLAAIEGGKGEVVAVGKFRPVELESLRRFFTGAAVPAVGENHAADVPKNSVDVGQRLLPGADD